MEGLTNNFDDPEKDEDKETKESQPTKSFSEAIEAILKREDDTETEPEPRSSFERIIKEPSSEEEDTAPELEAEAPLEHLSEVETEAIAQTLASERLDEIEDQTAEISSEGLAVESFLENVEASGDVDSAYQQTLFELGEAPSATQDYQTETAPPVDPESLIEAARNAITNEPAAAPERLPIETEDVLRPREVVAPLPPKPTEIKPAAEAQPEKAKPKKKQKGIVDYIVGRRHARISSEGHREDVQKKLEVEVDHLQDLLDTHERNIRRIAQDKLIERKEVRPKPPKIEKLDIGQTALKGGLPRHTENSKSGERAGIKAHTVDQEELLNVAKTVNVEGINLKQLYEAHLIGEQGIRRVVAEYLRGGKYEQVLRRELLERERDFERDPKLRDQASAQPLQAQSSDIDSLLKRHGIDWSEPPTAVSETKPKTNNLTALVDKVRLKPSLSRHKHLILDLIMFAAIGTLVIIIVILLINR